MNIRKNESFFVGKRIKDLRKHNKLSLKELSNRVGISISFLSDIENGRSNPSLERLKQIADGLNTSVSFLLNEEQADTAEAGNVNLKELISYDEIQELIDDAEFKCLIKYLADFPSWEEKDKEELVIYLKIKDMIRKNRKPVKDTANV